MRCYCGGGAQCFCGLTYVIYKLKCKTCSQCYIGKTIRQLWIRIGEHFRGIINSKRSALAKHQCRNGYVLRVLARSENNSEALRIMEGKMMNKYKPKINIKNEKSARERAEKMGKLLRNKDSCEPNDKLRQDRNNDDYEDEFEYWMESSDFLSNEVEREDENGTLSEAEANKKIDGEQDINFNANNYTRLAAIEAHKHNKPFDMTLNIVPPINLPRLVPRQQRVDNPANAVVKGAIVGAVGVLAVDASLAGMAIGAKGGAAAGVVGGPFGSAIGASVGAVMGAGAGLAIWGLKKLFS